MKNVLVIVSLLITNMGFGQNISENKVKFYLDSFLRGYLTKEISVDTTLSKAAKLQSDYILKNKELTHYQKDPNFRTPRTRVFKVNPNFWSYGFIRETAIMGSISHFYDGFKNIEEYIAFRTLNAFKNSPDHNEILLMGSVFGYGVSINNNGFSIVIDLI